MSTAASSAIDCLCEAGLGDQVWYPGTSEFAERLESYWSNSAKARPQCIFRPRSAEDVSKALRALTQGQEKFAIRSGGHMHWAGSNSVENGVTLDLGLLSSTTYDEVSQTANIGPGALWGEVLAKLQEHGRVVNGGREGNVGVAGFLLGGGVTYFTGTRGFGCDGVVAYEVVLADGRIVTADAKNHADLFRALKGGSSNFGVVTNFKMEAFQSEDVWGGMNFYPKTIMPDAIKAIFNFTENAHKDVDANLLCFITYTDIVIAVGFVHVGGKENAPAYEEWLELPRVQSTCKMTNAAEIVAEYTVAPKGYYNSMFTRCFKNDSQIMAKAAELHTSLVGQLKAQIPDGDFITQCIFQPMPALFGRCSSDLGGNVMGVDRLTIDGILFVALAMVRTREQEEFVYPKVRAWIDAVVEFAGTIQDGNLEWIYVNYADKSQDPLRSYGSENVARMRDVAAKYDPERVFQKLCPGGFKISDVDS